MPLTDSKEVLQEVKKALEEGIKVVLMGEKDGCEVGFEVVEGKDVQDKFGKNWSILRVNNRVDKPDWKGSWHRDWNGWPSSLASDLSFILND
jgi:hypothetical protein